jgi:site-specific DNA-methyltransferase (adenine-specific)
VKLIQGDCLEVMDKMIEKGIKVNGIFTDIPYGTTACAWDTIIPFDDMWSRLDKLITDNGAIVLNSSQPFTTELIHSNLKNFKHCWYWNKCNAGSFAVAKYRPLSVIEEICVFSNGGKVNYYPIMESAKEENKRPRGKSNNRRSDSPQGMASGEYQVSENHDENLRFPKNFIIYDNRKGELNSLKRFHPTQKPVEMLEYLINTYTKENDLILDFTCGSGTTLIASKNLKRRCIGIELDEKYCEVTKNRLEAII